MSLCGNMFKKLIGFLVFVIICFILYIRNVDVKEELHSWYVDVMPQETSDNTRGTPLGLDDIEKVTPHMKTTQSPKIYSNHYTIPPYARLLKKEYKMDFGNLSLSATKSPVHFHMRNISALRKQIGNIKSLLEPFIVNLSKHRSELMLQKLPWPEMRKSNNVSNAYKGNYFTTMKHSAIRTIQITMDKKAILQNLHKFVYDYSSNSCHKMSSLDNAEMFYGARCLPKGDTLKANPFQDIAWKVGLPANHTVQRGGKVTVTYIHVLKNAVITNKGDAFVNQVKIVPQRCNQNVAETIPPIKSPLEDEIFTIAQYGKSRYLNAIMEELSRIVPYLDFLRANPDIKIHVNIPTGFLKMMLEMLGMDQKRVISGSKRARILYMPAGPGCHKMSVFNTVLLSMEFRAHIPFPTAPRKSIVIIKRSRRQHFRQHAQIEETIKRLVHGTDINVETFSDKHLPPLNKTMALFNRAFLVVAPQGAGEANLLFSEPGTVLVEGLCTIDDKIDLSYRNLMRILGHRYYGHFPRKNCLDITPIELRGPVKYYIDELYFGKNQ